MTHSFPSRGRAAVLPRSGPLLHAFTGVLLYLLLTAFAHAHGVAEGDIQEISGTHLLPFTYLGAKHMVTGYDHLLVLAGVIFFLYTLKDIALYFGLVYLKRGLVADALQEFDDRRHLILGCPFYPNHLCPRKGAIQNAQDHADRRSEP